MEAPEKAWKQARRRRRSLGLTSFCLNKGGSFNIFFPEPKRRNESEGRQKAVSKKLSASVQVYFTDHPDVSAHGVVVDTFTPTPQDKDFRPLSPRAELSLV